MVSLRRQAAGLRARARRPADGVNVHEWSILSWRNLIWRGDSCCFVGAATYGLLGTGQAQIVDIRQEAPWGSVIWHLIAEMPCWFAPERGHCRTRVGRYLAAGSLALRPPKLARRSTEYVPEMTC